MLSSHSLATASPVIEGGGDAHQRMRGSRPAGLGMTSTACAAAGRRAGAGQTLLTTQREALRRLGVDGRRPAVTLAATDPEGYVRELCQATENAELIDADGLGGFGWLMQTVGMPLPAQLARPRPQ